MTRDVLVQSTSSCVVLVLMTFVALHWSLYFWSKSFPVDVKGRPGDSEDHIILAHNDRCAIEEVNHDRSSNSQRKLNGKPTYYYAGVQYKSFLGGTDWPCSKSDRYATVAPLQMRLHDYRYDDHDLYVLLLPQE